MNRWCDGFGRYGGSEAHMLNGSSSQAWAEISSGAVGWNLSSANPRTGAWHLRLEDGSQAKLVRRVFGTPLTEVFFGHALYFQELPSVEPLPGTTEFTGFFIAKFRDASNQAMVSVWLGTDGGIVVYRQGETAPDNFFLSTLLGRSDPVVGTGAYQHFEHYLKVGNGTSGAYELRIDEVTVLNLTGIDTDFGGGEVSQVTVGRSGGGAFGNAGEVVDMADCYVNDTDDDGSGCDTWVGDCKSGCRMVNADTAQADFALSTGVTGYELLDETPANDSDYIDTASSTAESDFGITDGPGNSAEILTARPFVRAMKDDAGTCLIAPSLKSGGVKATVSDQAVSTAFAYYDSNVPLDPDTGIPWLPADLDAAEHVVERTA